MREIIIMFNIIIQVVLLLIGFVLLIKGAEYFVNGASDIARILRVPAIIVGLTIVSLGTSAPEAAVSVIAAVGGNSAISISNIIGSNMFNLLAVVGISSLFGVISLKSNLIKWDMPFMIIVTILLALIVYFTDGVSRIAGICFLIILCLYIYYLIKREKKSEDAMEVEKPQYSKVMCIVYLVLGLVGIVIGGQLVVNSATSIATSFGLSQTLIGLTIVAIGTSLPELITSITAIYRDEDDIGIGNIIGSNIFNVLFIVGLSSAISPLVISTVIVDLVILIGVSVLCYVMGKIWKEYTWKQGLLLIALFIVYMVFIIIRN